MGKHLRINRLTLFAAVLAALALVLTGFLGHTAPAHAEPHQHVAIGTVTSDGAGGPAGTDRR
jgi:hypothetical protein